MWTTQLRSKSSKNITYYRKGSGLPLILIHGVGLKLESWNAQIQYLKKYFDVIAIDLPGHGESEILESRDVNIDLYSEAIKSFTDEIIQKKFIIIGHSLGALIALDYIKILSRDVDWSGAFVVWRVEVRFELGQQPQHLHVAHPRRDVGWSEAIVRRRLDVRPSRGHRRD